jgi:SecD/SecF fusion protein
VLRIIVFISNWIYGDYWLNCTTRYYNKLNPETMKHLLVFSLLLAMLLVGSCKMSKDSAQITVQLSAVELIAQLADPTAMSDSAFSSAYRYVVSHCNPETEDCLEVFANQLAAECPDCSLASYYLTFSLKDKVSFDSDNSEVIEVLREEIENETQKAVGVLERRIQFAMKPLSFSDKLFNKVKVTTEKLPGNHRYVFRVNRTVDAEWISGLLQSPFEINFYETYELSSIWENLTEGNIWLKENIRNEHPVRVSLFSDETFEETTDYENPLFSVLNPYLDNSAQPMEGPVVGLAEIKDTARVNEYLKILRSMDIFPSDLRFMWHVKPLPANENYFPLIALKTRRDEPVLRWEHIWVVEARQSAEGGAFNFRMTPEGTQLWRRITAENINLTLAVAVNNAVYFNPRVVMVVEDGNTTITGNFNFEELTEIEVLTNAGELKNVVVRVLEVQ